MTLAQLTDQAHDFLSKVFAETKGHGLVLQNHWHIDHICYRAATENSYHFFKDSFLKFSQLLIESEVNGRLISTFKLPHPIVFDDWEIHIIELPAPKKGKIVLDGFEHIEVVCDLSFDEIQHLFPRCRFDSSGLRKDFNQELEATFEDFSVKFHHLSLESVINLESNAAVFTALKQSQILKNLRPFQPLLAGTFPLNLNTAHSDLDILICAENLHSAKAVLFEKYKDFKNFKYQEIVVQNEKTLWASFSFQEIDFEIFGQKISPLKQQGYVHFLAEERLLKIGGAKLFTKLRELRNSGLKTEPAFGQALGLTKDPYAELHWLHKKPNKELKEILSRVFSLSSI